MTDLMPSLRTALLDLLYETRENDLRLIIGGGYGISSSGSMCSKGEVGRCCANGRKRGQPTISICFFVPSFSFTRHDWNRWQRPSGA